MRVLWGVLLAAGVARADPAGVVEHLPVPPAEPGAVASREPVAPVPAGEPVWRVGLSSAVGVADAFHPKFTIGAVAARGFGPWSLEVFGAKAVGWGSPSLAICTAGGACSTPTSAQLGATPGDLGWFAGVGGGWRFAVGKASFGAGDPAGFSLALRAGGAIVGWSVRDPDPRDVLSPGLRVGLGLGASPSRALDVRLDLDLLAYPADVRGATTIERQWLAGLGVGWTP